MANFTASNLVQAQALLKEQFTKNEMREKVLPALKLGLSNADVLIPSAKELRTREDRAVQAYVMKRQSRVPGSQRTYNHTGNRGDSFNVPLTWVTYTDTFSISLKEMDNNLFDFPAALAQNFKNAILNIHAQIETDEINYLITNSTQVVKTNTPIGTRVTWNPTNYAHEIQAADKLQFHQLGKMVMFENYYQNVPLDVIASASTYVNAEFYANQGGGNAQNASFQFTGMNVVPSAELSDGNYPAGISLFMPQSSFALLPWIPKQNIKGEGDYNSYTGGFGSMEDPFGTGLTYAVHGYSLRNDTSGLNGVQQDVELQVEVSVDIAQVLSPLSTAAESVVYKIAQTI